MGLCDPSPHRFRLDDSGVHLEKQGVMGMHGCYRAPLDQSIMRPHEKKQVAHSALSSVVLS